MAGAGDHVAGGEARGCGAVAHAVDQFGENFTGAADQMRVAVEGEPERLRARRASAARSSASMASSTASSGWRKSMVKNTSPGTTLRLFGRLSMQADGADGVGRMRAGDGVDAVDHARCAQERVLAQRHRRGAGVGFLAGHRDLVPAHALRALHDADGAAFGFEDRALLDVQLEHRRECVRAGGRCAAVADRGRVPRRRFCRHGRCARRRSRGKKRRQRRRRRASAAQSARLPRWSS